MSLMKLEKFTQKLRINLGQGLMVGFLALFMLLSTNQASAQNCPLVCNNNVQISLDDDCRVTVTPAMILEGEESADPTCEYRVVIRDLNGHTIPTSPDVTSDYVNQTLEVGVYNGPADTDNNCWGYIHIEDKIKPSVDCPDTIYTECYAVPATFAIPAGIDNCGAPVDVVEISDETTNLDCDDEYSAVRVITYQATDPSGNVSDYCFRVIYYERVSIADLEWPRNWDGIDTIELSCSSPYNPNSNNSRPAWDNGAGDHAGNYYPDPDETGAPHTAANDTDVYPDNILCELNVTYTDEVLNICENSYKVLRQWTVMDWCTGEMDQRFQIIKVMDSEGPVVTAVPDCAYTAYTHPYTCTAEFKVPAPIVAFDCGSWTYTVEYSIDNINPIYTDINVEGNATSGYTITNLTESNRYELLYPNGNPGGCIDEDVWVRYTVVDDCGNTTYAFTEIDVVDNTPPVAVCDQFTVATLTNTGQAYVEALSFDDGSHDNCTDVTFQVRRMTSGCGQGTSFGDYVIFCCNDIGNENLQVVLEVTDENGNSNTCMVNVTVQDKLPPIITCPDDIHIDCLDDYTDLTLTGEATAIDNCGNPNITFTDSGDLGVCNVGTITRRWTATDADGRTDKCTQHIYVENNHPFKESSIHWPADKELEGCMAVDTDPSNTGVPTYSDDACSLVAYTYEDQVFTFVDDACFKILRHWTVIDWCTYDENSGEGLYGPVTQIIKVFDNDAPVMGDLDSEFCIYEASTTQCGGQVDSLIQTATDDCSGSDDELTWSYVVEEDFDGNGVFQHYKSGGTRNANGYFLTGNYRVKWSVEDNCGNFTNKTEYFEVKDCKKPTPYCLGEVTTAVMNNNGTVEIWASDFDLGSFDNCTPGGDDCCGETNLLRFTFTSTPPESDPKYSAADRSSAKVFDCDDLGLNVIQMWVWDEAGNSDYCEVILNVQDHSNACPDGSGVTIAGMVRNENNEPMNGASVSLTEGAEGATVVHSTDVTGEFHFTNMTEGSDFSIAMSDDEDYMNGVSTLDLLLIQRHILKLKEFTSPYKVIASDIDNSGKINGGDLIQLRKLILGKYDELPQNDSWRFVVASQVFDDVQNPFPFNEVINLEAVTINDNTNNFTSVKIGDVNNSVSMDMNSGNQSQVRDGNTMTFNADNTKFVAGDMVELNLTAAQLTAIKGFQFTLDFNNDVLSFDHIVSNAINVNEDNIGTSLINRGKLNVSWSDIEAGNIGDALFTVVFKAHQAGQLSSVLDITSSATPAEAYDTDLETYNLELVYNNPKLNTQGYTFELLQNEPNPFMENTTVKFVLPNASAATLKVFDVTGKELVSMTGDFAKGENSFEISNNQLNVSGVLYYQLEADQYTATKKMVLMNK